MTLSSRHRIRNSSPGGLRPSTLPLGHGGSPQYWLWHVDGEETFFVSFKPPRPGTEPRTLAWKAAVLTTTLGPPPIALGVSLSTSLSLYLSLSLLLWWYCIHNRARFHYRYVYILYLWHYRFQNQYIYILADISFTIEFYLNQNQYLQLPVFYLSMMPSHFPNYFRYQCLC